MGARLISTRDASKVIELSGAVVTIGRGAECEYQLADERISTRHCRIIGHQGTWSIADMRSTNRTFVNGEQIGEASRRLMHGDIVRLGGIDAVLFEARFVETKFVLEERAAPRRVVDEAALERKIAELQEELRERSAELVRSNAETARVTAMYREVLTERAAQQSASAAAERMRALSSGEVDALREELAQERRDRAIDRGADQRALRRVSELEAQLAAQERKARADAQDGARHTKELDSKLRMALSDLALAREALAAANDSIRNLKQVCDDQRARLEAGIFGRAASS